MKGHRAVHGEVQGAALSGAGRLQRCAGGFRGAAPGTQRGCPAAGGGTRGGSAGGRPVRPLSRALPAPPEHPPAPAGCGAG